MRFLGVFAVFTAFGLEAEADQIKDDGCIQALSALVEYDEDFRSAVLSFAPVGLLDGGKAHDAYLEFGRAAASAFNDYKEVVVSECQTKE